MLANGIRRTLVPVLGESRGLLGRQDLDEAGVKFVEVIGLVDVAVEECELNWVNTSMR